MKHFEPTENRTTVAVYVFIVALFAVFCVIVGVNIRVFPVFFSYVGNVLSPIFYGFAIAFTLSPLVRLTETGILSKWKAKKGTVKRIVSTVIVYVFVLLIIFLFVMAIIPEISKSYEAIGGQYGDFDDRVKTKTSELVSMFPGRDSEFVYYDTVPDLRKDITEDVIVTSFDKYSASKIKVRTSVIQDTLTDITEKMFSSLTEFVSDSLPEIFSSAIAILNWTKNILIGLIVSFYFLVREKQLISKLSGLLRVWFPNRVYRYSLWVIEKAKNIFRDYIIVRVLDGAIVGVLMYICLSLFRTPYAMFLSVIMGAASFFPFIGPVVGILAGSLITLIADSGYIIVFLVIAVVLNLLDSRYVEPFLNSGRRNHKLSAIWVFTAIVIMGGLFGVTGIVFGIPMFAFGYSIVKEVGERMLKRKGLPKETVDYIVMRPKKAAVTEEGEEPTEDITDYLSERKEDEEEELKKMKETAKNVAGKVKKVFKKKKSGK